MMESLEVDEDAFLKKQFEWMGISEENQRNIMMREEEKKRELLEEKIKAVPENGMSKQENIDWKVADNKCVVNLIIYFLRIGGVCDNQKAKYLQRPDTPLTGEYFNKSMELAGLPYEMIMQRANSKKNIDGIYRIQKNLIQNKSL